mgnify:CR=1 FL=1|jgi:hypothetical protein
MILFKISRTIRILLLRILIKFRNEKTLIYFRDDYGDYAIERDLPIETVLTLGVGNNVEFEKWLLKSNPNIQFILVDPVINVDLANTRKIEKLITREIDETCMYSRKRLDDNSFSYYIDENGTYSGISLNQCLQIDDNEILLKFDIEGFEYIILEDLANLIRNHHINQIVCELHWNWYNLKSIMNVYNFFKRLRREGLYPVWFSSLGKEFLITKDT